MSRVAPVHNLLSSFVSGTLVRYRWQRPSLDQFIIKCLSRSFGIPVGFDCVYMALWGNGVLWSQRTALCTGTMRAFDLFNDYI